MAFKEVSDLSADVTISLGGFNKKLKKDNPTSVEGYYLGFRTVPDKKKKSGISHIYFFQTPKGNIGVWGKTDMDNKLKGVTVGNMVRVSFDRMVPTPNGEMYKYKVQFDADNSIEVIGTPEVAEPSYTDSDEAYVSATSETEEEDNSADEDERQAIELAALERKAKIEALLKTKKAKVG